MNLHSSNTIAQVEFVLKLIVPIVVFDSGARQVDVYAICAVILQEAII